MPNTIMKRLRLLLLLALLSLTAAVVRADETNVFPKSNLEAFEERTGVVLIRGSDDLGVIEGKNGELRVRLRESRDTYRNERAYGVFVSTGNGLNSDDTSCVDYDELAPIIHALNYLGKVEWSVSALSHFEAGYTTRSGLKVASYSSRRSGSIEAMVLTGRTGRSRCLVNQVQFAQLRILLEQAKAKIEVLMKEK